MRQSQGRKAITLLLSVFMGLCVGVCVCLTHRHRPQYCDYQRERKLKRVKMGGINGDGRTLDLG